MACLLSLGVVFLRQEDSTVATRIASIEKQLAEAKLDLQAVEQKMAEVHMPENLILMAGRELVPPEENQVVWIDRLEMPRQSPERDILVSETPRSVSLDLAFMHAEYRMGDR